MTDAIVVPADATTAPKPAGQPTSIRDRLRNTLAARNLDQLEELVLELIGNESDVTDIDSLINDISDRLERIGEGRRVVPMLMIAATELRPRGMARQALGWLKRAVRLAPRSEGLGQELVETYRAAYPNHSGLDSLFESAGLLNPEPGVTPRLREAIDDMENALFLNEGDFVLHQGGWGVGKVRTVHAERSVLVVDFQTKPGHEIAMTMAKKALRKLEPDHVAVLRWTNPERLSSMAKEDPVGLLKLAVNSLGGKALLKDVRASLSGAAMPEGEWSRWWAKARKAAVNDPLLEIAGAPKTTLRVLDEPRDDEAEVQKKFARAFTISERVDLARNYMRHTQDGRRSSGRKASKSESSQPLRPALAGMITAISEELGTAPEDIKEDSVRPGRRDQLSSRLDAVLVVREAARRFADCAELVTASSEHPAAEELPAPEILAARLRIIGDSPTRVETLYAMEEAFGEEAANNIVALLKAPGLWDMFEEGAAQLNEMGHPDHFKELARDLLVSPRDHPDSFAALSRAYLTGKLEDICPDIGNPIEFALKTLNVLDYLGRELQMVVSDIRKLELKASLNHLRTTLLERSALSLKRVAEDGSTEDVDQAFRLIRRTSGLTDNQKYQLEKPLIKAQPDVVKRNEPAAAARANVPKVIYSTNSGLQRREAELRHLVEVEIPENSRDIGRAAAMGDLSENAEWTAAIERQGFLTKRAEELEAELKRVQVLDPSNTDLSRANFGTRVTLYNLDDQTEERYAILGPWDKDIECEVISHLATLAAAIQDHVLGDQVEVELPDCTKRYEIKALEIAKPMDFVAPKRQPNITGGD